MKIGKLNKLKKKNKKLEEKIQFGEKALVCFACGQEINEATKKCPYCGTKI